MYSILLTDDEQIVTDSLAFIIEKNFPGQCNIFKAGSGSEAIHTCRTNKIDIIFMDINMPGLNGLEAINEIKQFNPAAVVIILSAFDKFQYAQEAMSLGAFRYLTKPVNRNLVTQTVRNAMGIIDSIQGKLSNDIEIKEKLSFVSNIVESDFIYSSIFAQTDSKDLHRYFDYFKMPEDCYFYMSIELPAISSERRYEVYLTVRDIVVSASPCIVGPFMSGRIVVFVPFESSGDQQGDLVWQKDFVREIFSSLSVKVGINVRIGVGLFFDNLKDTVAAYNTALEALNSIPAGGGTSFASKDIIRQKDFFADASRYEQQLLCRVSAGDVSGAKSQALLWIESIFGNESINLDFIRNSIFRILVTARASASEIRKGYSNDPSFNNTFTILGECLNREDFSLYFVSEIEDCTRIIFEVRNTRENPVVTKAKAYIEEHIGGELSLDQTADAVGVNPYYLSKLFKDETGSNFIDFVNENRLEKAKNLLKKGEQSIKEVSFECGYSDQNYFSKIFRRKFGITPTEFRNSL